MLVVLSPSKNLHKAPASVPGESAIRFPEETNQLIQTLQKQKIKDLQKLMDINEKLAALNAERYQAFSLPHTTENATPAITTFSGDVYQGLQAESLSKKDLLNAQKTIRILSGLYGILKPFDLIQPYRLEMGTSLHVARKKSLYAFWGDKITDLLIQDIEESKSKELINLASQEYMQAISNSKLPVPVIEISFLEDRNGKLQFLSYNAKRSRGWMARYIVQHGIKRSKDLQSFTEEGYTFRGDLSTADKLVFVR